LTTADRERPYEALRQIGQPEAAAMAALFLADPHHTARVSFFAIAADSPKALGSTLGDGAWSIPAAAQGLLRPHLNQLRREGRGRPGSRFFPDRKWDPEQGRRFGSAWEQRLLRRLPGAHPRSYWFREAGFEIFDLRTVNRPELDVESPLGQQLESAWLVHEIISTRDAIVVGALDEADAILVRRLIETGLLEERNARVGPTEGAAWSLFLDDELDLPCSGYRRHEVLWPVASSQFAAS
jgi:hypothetical protein